MNHHNTILIGTRESRDTKSNLVESHKKIVRPANRVLEKSSRIYLAVHKHIAKRGLTMQSVETHLMYDQNMGLILLGQSLFGFVTINNFTELKKELEDSSLAATSSLYSQLSEVDTFVM